MSTRKGGVCLSKWYLDCVTARGDAWVGYHVELRWRALKIRFGGFTVVEGDSAPVSRLSVRNVPEPVDEAGVLSWNAPGLQLRGRWDAECERLDAPVLENEGGRVDWRCLQPASRVQLATKRGEVAGFGYAEQLVLTLPPWQLPIAGLRWGRFVAEGHALVWIDWEGDHRFRLLAHNGRRIAPGAIGEAAVASQDGTVALDLERHAVLREGELGQTLGRLLPKLPTLPQRLLGLVEQKWIARGTLKLDGKPAAAGWVIHERVRWPAGEP